MRAIQAQPEARRPLGPRGPPAPPANLAGVVVLAITDFIGDVIETIGGAGLALLLRGETFAPPVQHEAIPALVARVIPLARSYISLPAGTMRMNVVTFSALTVVGSAIWNAALIGAGWAL